LKNDSSVPFFAQFERCIEELARKQTHIFKENLKLSGSSGGTNGIAWNQGNVDSRNIKFKFHCI
jgi:hypothetical protein